MTFYDVMREIWLSTGVINFTPGQIIMIFVSLLLIYLAIKKEFEPLLLLPIGFGGMLANIPVADIAEMSRTFLDPNTQRS
jgi:oxaloacetate decarboxylase beta subunit